MHSDTRTLSKASIWREASRIVYEEGFRAFWKGNLVTIVHRLPYSISFYAYERYKTFLQHVPGLDKHGVYVSADIGVQLLGSGLAGITVAFMTYPLDLVRTSCSSGQQCLKVLITSPSSYLHCKVSGMKPFGLFLLVLLVSILPAIIWGRNNFMLAEKTENRKLIPSSMELGLMGIKRQLQQAPVFDNKENDYGVEPAGSSYPGTGTQGHHTIDLETWEKQHPTPPYNRMQRTKGSGKVCEIKFKNKFP